MSAINNEGEGLLTSKISHKVDMCMTRNITVTIPIKTTHQGLIAAAIGANGNNIKSVKARIVSGMNPKFLYIYIKGDEGNKYWHLTVSVTDPIKWKLLERAHSLLDRHLEFFHKKKITNNAVSLIQTIWRTHLKNKQSDGETK
jgi:hypothetical protein